ncbi:MAG: hydrogenase nickel incorporation protein HypB [Methanomassiliicoccales archaeon]|nr:MAG: hydrogenase nickel incorporation protein HypB [Methanomassiliicoccales archaeon]
MHKVTDISMEMDVLEENKHLAEHNHENLRARGIRSVDVMGSIGSGKTAMIIALAKELRKRGVDVAVIAGDVTGQDDFDRFQDAGIRAYNINTGKECHLDSRMIDHALDHMDLEGVKFLFIENVGNLVCPADFPLGTDHRMVVISVTEGDDMVRKHPMIFNDSDIAVLNKIDLAEYMQVDVERIKRDYRSLRPGKELYLTSVRTGAGLDRLLKALGFDK